MPTRWCRFGGGRRHARSFPRTWSHYPSANRGGRHFPPKKNGVNQARQNRRGQKKLRGINPTAAIVRVERCQIDPELLFGIGREKKVARPEHKHRSEEHTPELQSHS